MFKRILPLILVLVLCLSLAACDTGSKKEIVGDWLSFGPTRFVFNADGTGTYYFYDIEEELTWKYDKDLSVYVVATNGQNVNATVKTDGETQYLSCAGIKHYAPDVFAQKVPARLEAARQEMAETVYGSKLELGEEYPGGNITAKFDLKIEEGAMWLYVEVRNNGTTPLTVNDFFSEACPVYAGYKISYFTGDGWSKSVGGALVPTEFVGGQESIEPGQTGTVRMNLVARAQMLYERYGAVLGYVTCSVGNSSEDFYLDFSDYTPN